MIPPLNQTVLRYLTAFAVAVVLAVLLSVIGIALARGTDISSSQVLGLLAFVGTLVGILVSLLQGNANAAATHAQEQTLARVEDKVNGHLDRHLGHSDEQIQAMIEERIARRLGPPPPAQGG